MSTEPPQPSISPHGHPTLYALITAVIAFAGIGIVVSRLGLEPLAAGVFALLSAFAIAGFVFRERMLLERVSALEAGLCEHQSKLFARIDHWYKHSGVALVKYDASTLIIIRMGNGCAELLGLDSESKMAGGQLEDLLQVEASRLEVITEQIRQGIPRGSAPMLCRVAGGNKIEVGFSGVYLPEEHAVEMVLICQPDSFTRLAELQETMDDLERFRKGMMRREKRILDLKSEVNELLVEAKQAPRYAIDSKTSDRKVHTMYTRAEEGEA